jgi:hypothetical protein
MYLTSYVKPDTNLDLNQTESGDDVGDKPPGGIPGGSILKNPVPVFPGKPL